LLCEIDFLLKNLLIRLEYATLTKTNYFNTDIHVQIVKAEPSPLIPRKLAANLELIIIALSLEFNFEVVLLLYLKLL